MNKTPLIDPIPESFATIEEAAKFWDTHSIADYWDEMTEVDFEIELQRPNRITVAADLSAKLATVAQRQGVSMEADRRFALLEKPT